MPLKPKILVIVGPTASGKSSLAISIAKEIGGEIVSADSQQVYRGMDIGTGKASLEERESIPHHVLDVLNPDEEMTAARFVELADAAIATIHERKKKVIVAGGTMLYVKALLRGLFEGPAADPQLREQLEEEAVQNGVASLWTQLQTIDPESADRIHDTDKRRLIRAIEVYRGSGIALSEHHRRHRAQPPRYRAKIIGLAPEREALYGQINLRVESMMAAGLLQEVEILREKGFLRGLRSQQAIGYAELHDHLDGEQSLSEAIALVQRNSRRYARRQLSWYRGDTEVEWLESGLAVDLPDIERYLDSCRHD